MVAESSAPAQEFNNLLNGDLSTSFNGAKNQESVADIPKSTQWGNTCEFDHSVALWIVGEFGDRPLMRVESPTLRVMMMVQLVVNSTTAQTRWLPTVTLNSPEGNIKRTARHKEGDHEHAIANDPRTLNLRADLKGHPCDEFIVNKREIDYKLTLVGRCLTHLFLTEDLECCESGGLNIKQLAIASYQIQVARQKFEFDRMRLEKIIDIYTIMLKRLPLCIQGPPTARLNWENRGSACSRANLLETRKHVLNLIEQLGGFCDSIDLLRCTLRSQQMIGVIYAYDVISKKLLSQGNIDRHTKDSRAGVSAESLVIKEWSV